jgi:large subunit ribosomal protein L1
MSVRSKRFIQARKSVDRNKVYSVEDSIELLKSFPSTKFDETVEMHIKLGIDPAKSDQQVRGTISLPNGTGKNVRVLVFAKGEQAEVASRLARILLDPTIWFSRFRVAGPISMSR